MSPVFRREKGYTFKVFSNEEDRMHIHVVRSEHEAKFWLEPQIELAENYGFNTKEVKWLMKFIEDHGDNFKEQFRQHIGKRIDD